MRFKALFALPLLVLGCSDAVSPGPLSGQWAEEFRVPGSSFAFTVTQDGTSLTGTGTYAMEAGSSGAFAVRGSYQLNSVRLTLTYDTGPRWYFQGQVLGGSMVGTMTDSASYTSSLTFVRR